MESKNYLDDISEIKTMMHRSSRFLSLSGLSGVLAGVYALIGAFLARQKLNAIQNIDWYDLSDNDSVKIEMDLVIDLFIIAGGVLFLALLTGAILSMRKAKKSGEKIWNPTSRRLLLNFLIPLVTGGLFCLVLMQYGFAGLVAPATLIFYGLSCVNASKYTLGDVRYMGVAFVLIGLINTQFISYGLYFWALGFGVFHIIYGGLMYFKYDRS
ncbi:MAG: hypothetical protein AAFX53_07480 [Bacteroidota bacterium]